MDNKPAPRQRFGGRGRFNQQRFQRRDQDKAAGGDVGQGAARERARQQRIQSKKQQQWNTWAFNRNREQVTYGSSVDIRPEWSVLEQVQLSTLTKLQMPADKTGRPVIPEPEELGSYGKLRWFNKAFDKVTPKFERELSRTCKPRYNVTTSDDPVMEQFAKKKAGTVFATDSMVAAIMCAARSVYSWDLVMTKEDGQVFFDKRDEGNFDLLTVSETSQEPISDDKENINGVSQLSKESTTANGNFAQQVLVEESAEKAMDFGAKDPFVDAGEDAAVAGYRYRKWKLSDDITLVARCALDGVVESKGTKSLLSIKALTEFDSKVTGVDWRQKIETQRGAVIATELKNNANKLAKWTCSALLAGADQMKLGFVSRVHPKDPNAHAIINTQTYKPKDFAQQINLTEGNMWGVFKSIAETCLKMDDGKYLLVKDPNKPIIRIYEVPADAFNDDYAKEPIG